MIIGSEIINPATKETKKQIKRCFCHFLIIRSKIIVFICPLSDWLIVFKLSDKFNLNKGGIKIIKQLKISIVILFKVFLRLLFDCYCCSDFNRLTSSKGLISFKPRAINKLMVQPIIPFKNQLDG